MTDQELPQGGPKASSNEGEAAASSAEGAAGTANDEGAAGTANDEGAAGAPNGEGNDQAAADEAAQEAGFANAATQQAAEAAAKKPKRRKRSTRKRSTGFELKANDPKALKELSELAIEGHTLPLALGTKSGPDKALDPQHVQLQFLKRKVSNAAKIAFSGAALEQTRTVTHVFVLDDKSKPVVHRELPAPIIIMVGEQLAFDAGSIVIPIPAAADEK